MAVQVPGFTHPVQDLYLEDVLSSLGYGEAVQNGAMNRNGAGLPSKRVKLGRERLVAIQEAIKSAFVEGGDEHFDALMEVRAAFLGSELQSECARV